MTLSEEVVREVLEKHVGSDSYSIESVASDRVVVINKIGLSDMVHVVTSEFISYKDVNDNDSCFVELSINKYATEWTGPFDDALLEIASLLTSPSIEQEDSGSEFDDEPEEEFIEESEYFPMPRKLVGKYNLVPIPSEPTLEEKVKKILEPFEYLEDIRVHPDHVDAVVAYEIRSICKDEMRILKPSNKEVLVIYKYGESDFERHWNLTWRQAVCDIAALLKHQQPVSEVEQLKSRVAELEKQLEKCQTPESFVPEKQHLEKVDGLMADVRSAEDAYEDMKSKCESTEVICETLKRALAQEQNENATLTQRLKIYQAAFEDLYEKCMEMEEMPF